MKKIVIATLALFAIAGLSASAQSGLSELLNRLKNGSQTQAETQTGNDNSNKSNPLDALRGLGNALGIIPSKTVDAKYLCGKWAYQGPAVAFKSDNFLAKAGGVAAATKIQNEIEPYYKRVGLDKMTLDVAADSTFTMTMSRGKLTGTIATVTTDKDAPKLIFSFKAMGKLPIGSMEAFVNAESDTMMTLTFDVSKLMAIIQKVASFTGNKSLTTLSSLLDNYDGITAGFRMKKTATAK